MGGSEATNGFSNGHQSNTDASTRSLHVLIVGGGLGGLSTAIAASLAGHRVTVLEAASKLSEVGAGIQLTPNVTRLLRRWGVFESLEPVAVKPSTIYFRRWQTGRVIGITDLETFEDNFGAPYWVVHRAHLHQALVDRAVVLGARVIVNSRVSSVDFDQATVTAVSSAGQGSLTPEQQVVLCRFYCWLRWTQVCYTCIFPRRQRRRAARHPILRVPCYSADGPAAL